MGFDLSDYEDVASLNRWFQDNYPMGRIAMDVVSDDSKIERIVILVSIYRDINDPHPAIQNIARGKQEEYNRNMARFYAEDVATSAIGRAILLLKGADKTAHKEGMERAKASFEDRAKSITKVQVENPKDPWTIQEKPMPLPVADAVAALNDGVKPQEIPMCPKHNKAMVSRNGNKNGKEWMHYRCPESWPNKCEEIIWMEIDKSGRWVPQKPKQKQPELA